MSKKTILIAVIIIFAAIFYLITKKSHFVYPPPKVANNVNLNRYAGTWYEVALIPNSFEKGCSKTKAIYTVMNDYIKVENSCYLAQKGNYKKITGKAWPVNKNNSKLKVQFYWPFKGDYWILYVDKDYQHALVGDPTRKYLWLLARKPMITQIKYNKMITIAKNQGYDISKLTKTQHD